MNGSKIKVNADHIESCGPHHLGGSFVTVQGVPIRVQENIDEIWKNKENSI